MESTAIGGGASSSSSDELAVARTRRTAPCSPTLAPAPRWLEGAGGAWVAADPFTAVVDSAGTELPPGCLVPDRAAGDSATRWIEPPSYSATARSTMAVAASGNSTHRERHDHRGSRMRASTRAVNSAPGVPAVISRVTSSMTELTRSRSSGHMIVPALAQTLPHGTARFGDAPFHGAHWRIQHPAHLFIAVLTALRQQQGIP